MTCLLAAWLVLWTAAAPVAAAPPAPEGAGEGEVVEIDGELYEVRDGELVLFGSEPAPAEDERGADAERAPDAAAEDAGEAGQDAAAAADEEPAAPRPQTIQVTSSRVDEGARATVATEVIDNERITETGARNLADLLERTPGMSVSSSLGTGQEVSIDGLDPKHVLILIDGRPVNGRVNDRVDVSRLPISAADVERVEIVRGPMSATYGSEALGGVVNIITRRPQPGLSGSVELGTRVTRQGALRNAFSGSGSASAGDLLFKGNSSFTLERGVDRAQRGDDGFVEDVPDGRLDSPHRRQATVGGEVGYFLGDIYLRGWANGSYNEVETRISRALPLRSRIVDLQGQAGVGADVDLPHNISVDGDLRVDRYFHQLDQLPDGGEDDPPPFCEDKDDSGVRFFDPACPAPTNVNSFSTQDQVRLDVHVTQPPRDEAFGLKLPSWAGQVGWAAGTVHQFLLINRQTGDGISGLSGDGFRWQGSLYAEGVFRPWSFLSVVPAVRGDLAAGDLLAGSVGPKLSARVELPAGVALRGSYGRGFRLPSFGERFLIFQHPEQGYCVLGNEDLGPETVDGVRGEVVWQASERVQLGAETFLNLGNDFIAFQPVGVTETCPNEVTYTYQNLSRAWTSGLNLRATAAQLAGFSLDVGYQYLFGAVDASQCPDGNPYFCSEDEGARSLFGRPNHSGNLSLRYLIAPTTTTLFSRVDFQDSRQMDEQNTAPAYVRLGVGVSQPVLDHLFFTLTLDNLLDNYDPEYGPKPGRHATLSVRGSL